MNKVIIEGFKNKEEAESFVEATVEACGFLEYTTVMGNFYINVRKEKVDLGRIIYDEDSS